MTALAPFADRLMFFSPNVAEQRCAGALHRFARRLVFIMQRSLSSRLCLILVLPGVAASQPTFPDGVSQILENMGSRLPNTGDDRAKVEQLIAAGSASLTDDVTDEYKKSDFEKACERDSLINFKLIFVNASL